MGRLKKRRELRIVRKEDRRMENIYQPAAAKVIITLMAAAFVQIAGLPP